MSILVHIERARSLVRAGSLEDALSEYEIALRRVTPDEHQIELAMQFVETSKTVNTTRDPRADAVDSGLRAEIVDVLRQMGRFAEARHHAEIALYLDRTLGNRNNISASLHDLGLISVALGQQDAAQQYFQESEAIDSELKSTGGEGGAELDFRKLVRGSQLEEHGFILEALKEIEEVLPRVERNLQDPMKIVDALNSASQCLQNLGEHVRAIDYLQRAVRIQQSISPNHPQLGRLYANLAIAYSERRDFKKTDEYLHMMRDLPPTISEQSLGKSLASTLNNHKWRQESWIAAGSYNENSAHKKSHDIFISYNTRDEELVSQLHDALENMGLRAWTYKECEDWKSVKPVSKIDQSVATEIEASRLLLIVVTGTSITSEWVFAEIRCAYEKDIPVVAWYPSGVRLVPQDAATRTDLSVDHLNAIRDKLNEFGVYAFYGYGTRERSVNVPTAAVAKMFTTLFPARWLPLDEKTRRTVSDALDGTRMLPVFVNTQGELIAPLQH